MPFTKYYNISLDLLGEAFDVDVNYAPATPDRMYLPNGDPGYPGDPAEYELRAVRWHSPEGLVDITPLWDALELDSRFYDSITSQLAEKLRDD